MARQRHLPKAPITEALIDLHTAVPSSVDTAALRLEKGVARDYPTLEEQRVLEGVVQLGPGQQQIATRDRGVHGYIRRSVDGRNVVQFRRDGFTFSRLHPYTEWESVLAESRRLWDVYRSVAAVERVTRVGVRYINHLRFRLPFDSFDDFLTAPPSTPPGVPSTVSSFLSRVTVHSAESGVIGRITQALDGPPVDNAVVVLLDIHAYAFRQFPADSEEMWRFLQELREAKNAMFFGSITERTAERYD